MSYQLEDIAQDGQFDVVVIGAGAAGMQAALFAAIDGARVLLVERTGYVDSELAPRRQRGAGRQRRKSGRLP
jgi:ribulose 1,5-bisphosphate synthetase/thiazole synthase